MKKFLLVLLVLFLLGGITFFILDEEVPEGIPGPEAEALAERMLKAVNHAQWEKIPFVSWSFREKNHYVWDKQQHAAQIKWEDMVVVMNLNTLEGKAFRDGERLSPREENEAIQEAWNYWCNDSFWLCAPMKVNDPGTVRKLVKADDGSNQLLVEYVSGGVTPGDSYLWILDENHMPQAYKMWVSIIPIGGVEATWEGWINVDGAKIATKHKLGPLDIPVTNVVSGTSPEDFDLPADYFQNL